MRNVSLRVAASLVLALCLDLFQASAQNASVSTDMVSYANFATLNLEASVPMARHWSVNASVKYNPLSLTLEKGVKMHATSSRLMPWECAGGHGMCIPAGGSAENCNTRNIMSEA